MKVIGLSGASGFLGLHLLQELVKEPVLIKCFIRNKETFNLKKKQFNLKFSEKNIEFYTSMDSKNFSSINNFIHSAAQLHSLKNLNQLWEDNVVLTEKILNLLEGKMHYISTLSVFASSNKKGIHLEEPIINEELYGGYAQSKLISENIVNKVKDNQIFRLGLLTPSHLNPFFQTHEFMYVFILLLKQMKIHPENYEEAFVDLSPVDNVAKMIISEMDSNKKIIHIANKESVSLSSILKIIGTKEVTYKVWKEELNKLKRTQQILLFYAFFKSQALEQYFNYYNIDLFQSTGHNWQGQITTNILEEYIKNV